MSATQDDIKHLRRELVARLDAVPFQDWSPRLLKALIGVFDPSLGDPPERAHRPADGAETSAGDGMSTTATESLRRELVGRIRKYPVRQWSPALIRAVNVAIDVEFTGPPTKPHFARRPKLLLVSE